jgi:hypothetical protein
MLRTIDCGSIDGPAARQMFEAFQSTDSSLSQSADATMSQDQDPNAMVLPIWLCRREDLPEGGMETPLTSTVEAVRPPVSTGQNHCAEALARHLCLPIPAILLMVTIFPMREVQPRRPQHPIGPDDQPCQVTRFPGTSRNGRPLSVCGPVGIPVRSRGCDQLYPITIDS